MAESPVEIPMEDTSDTSSNAVAPSPPVLDVSDVNDSIVSSQRPVSATGPQIPGLNEMVNEWQISHISEEKQFFSTEVPTRASN